MIYSLGRKSATPRTDTYFLTCILILSSHLRLGVSRGLFLVGLPVKIVKALLRSSILSTFPGHLSF